MKSILLIILLFTMTNTVNAQETTVTDEEIMKILATAKSYTFVLLVPGSKDEKSIAPEEMEKKTMAHLRYLFTLKKKGVLPIFGPLTDGGKIHGILLFNTDKTDEVKAWLDQDPLVKDKLVSYEMHPYFGIPGDKIPDR